VTVASVADVVLYHGMSGDEAEVLVGVAISTDEANLSLKPLLGDMPLA
jgi:hypothetical protein